MTLNWKVRLDQQPSLRDINNWPRVPLDSIAKSKQKAFLRNHTIIAQILGGQSLKATARLHNLSNGRISQLLNRCLGGEEDTPPALTHALIPFANVTKTHRKKPLPSQEVMQGTPGAFQALLNQLPPLRDALDEFIVARLKDTDYAQPISPKALHGHFMSTLAGLHWPTTTYPYTHVNMARESVRRYGHKRTLELKARRTTEQARRPKRVTGARRHSGFHRIQIDEHTVHAHHAIQLELDNRVIPIRLARATVLLAIHAESTCVLGYQLVPTQHPTQHELLQLLDNCIQVWRPLPLSTPGLSYLPGACFPSALNLPVPVTFNQVFLDNAMIHRARTVRDFLTGVMGASIHLGLPGQPLTRELVERAFKRTCQHLSHRLPSSTGSHPRDPISESRKNRKKVPVVTYPMFNDMLSVVLTQHNCTPSPSLYGATPLETYQETCTQHYMPFIPDNIRNTWSPMRGEMRVPLHWYHTESRAPHVNFEYARYRGSGLYAAAEAGDKHIQIVFNRNDIRTVSAFRVSGEPLGKIAPPATWQRFSHSIATRRYIHDLCKEKKMRLRDPLADTFRYLLENKGNLKIASQMLRVYSEYTENYSIPLCLSTETSDASDTPSHTRIKWHSGMASHRG